MPSLPKLLIVDDEPSPRLALKWILERQTQCTFFICTGEADALKCMEDNPDIAAGVIDLNLGRTTGIDLVKKLRLKNPKFRAALHSAVESSVASAVPEQDRRLFCAFLPKPASSNAEVLRVVSMLLQKEPMGTFKDAAAH